MKATEKLRNSGQSLWLDNITRDLLTSGTLKRYIDTLSVTGLTSNPTIFDHAISKSAGYDQDIRALTSTGVAREDLFFRLAIADLQQAADLFMPIHDRTAGVDGWVSLEVSPLLAYDTQRTVGAASSLHPLRPGPICSSRFPEPRRAPGDRGSHLPRAFRSTSHCCSRANDMLLRPRPICAAWSADHAGLEPGVRSVASLFVSRWDKATMEKLPENLRDRLGIAIAQTTYAAYRDLLDSERWQRLENWGAAHNDCCLRAPARKTPAPPTRSTSALWPRRTPSTRFPRKRCCISPITA